MKKILLITIICFVTFKSMAQYDSSAVKIDLRMQKASKDFEKGTDYTLIGITTILMGSAILGLNSYYNNGQDKGATTAGIGLCTFGFGFTYVGYIKIGLGARKLRGLDHY